MDIALSSPTGHADAIRALPRAAHAPPDPAPAASPLADLAADGALDGRLFGGEVRPGLALFGIDAVLREPLAVRVEPARDPSLELAVVLAGRGHFTLDRGARGPVERQVADVLMAAGVTWSSSPATRCPGA